MTQTLSVFTLHIPSNHFSRRSTVQVFSQQPLFLATWLDFYSSRIFGKIYWFVQIICFWIPNLLLILSFIMSINWGTEKLIHTSTWGLMYSYKTKKFLPRSVIKVGHPITSSIYGIISSKGMLYWPSGRVNYSFRGNNGQLKWFSWLNYTHIFFSETGSLCCYSVKRKTFHAAGWPHGLTRYPVPYRSHKIRLSPWYYCIKRDVATDQVDRLILLWE